MGAYGERQQHLVVVLDQGAQQPGEPHREGGVRRVRSAAQGERARVEAAPRPVAAQRRLRQAESHGAQRPAGQRRGVLGPPERGRAVLLPAFPAAIAPPAEAPLAAVPVEDGHDGEAALAAPLPQHAAAGPDGVVRVRREQEPPHVAPGPGARPAPEPVPRP